MKNKKTIQDKATEIIEQDILKKIYNVFETNYKADKKIVGLYTTTDNFNKKYEKFANITKVDNGYELEDISDEGGFSTIKKTENKKLKMTGFFIKDVVKDKTAYFLNTKTDNKDWWISILSEAEYFEIKIKETKDELEKRTNSKIRNYDSVIQDAIHYMENDIENNRDDIRDLREEVYKICVWFGIFIVLLFMGFIAIFTKLPK